MDDADRWFVETALLGFYGLIVAVALLIAGAAAAQRRKRR